MTQKRLVTAMCDALGAGAVLTGIERQLTQAAEMQLTGRLSDELYLSLVRGALALLPMLETPKHIVVLKALKVWREDELLPVQVHEQLQAAVVAASNPAAAVEAAAPATEGLPSPAAVPAKKQKVEPSQGLITNWEGAEKQRILTAELRAQRVAASRGEDYQPEVIPVIRFASESNVVVEASPPGRKCPKCPKEFSTSTGLFNHIKWHHPCSQNKLFAPPPPKVLPPVECELCVEGGDVQVCLRIGGRSLTAIAEAVAAGKRALVERDERRAVEAIKRQYARDKASSEDCTENRKGSARRGSFTARMKLKV